MRATHLNRKGSISAYMLIIGIILWILGAGSLTVGYHATARAIRTADEMLARAVADAGLDKAMCQLSMQYKDGSLDDNALPSETNREVPNCSGQYSYTIRGDKSSGYTITSMGTYNGTQRATEVFIQAQRGYDYAVFAQNSISVSQTARIDGYNYEDGGSPLKVGTSSTSNNAIHLSHSSIINGDIEVGEGGDPAKVIKKTQVTQYTGQAYAADFTYVPTPVVVPASLNSATSGGNITGNKTIATSGKYDSISLDVDEKLTISGTVALYITGDIRLDKESVIEIDNGASLTLYCGGKITTQKKTSINNLNQTPVTFRIMGLPGSGTIDLGHQTDIYGVVYAPDSEFVSSESATVYGCVVAKSFRMDSAGKILYDATLRDASWGDNISLKPERWCEY